MTEIADLITRSSPEELRQLLDQFTPEQLQDALAGLDPAEFPVLLDGVDPAVPGVLAQGISTPAELRRFLELAGGDDRIVDRFLARAGAGPMLDRVFALMGTRFMAGKVGNESGEVEWHVKTPEGELVYTLAIAHGQAGGGRGPAADRARTTLTISAADLLRLCAGTLDGVSAFMAGKIRLAGDMLFGAKLPAAFDTR